MSGGRFAAGISGNSGGRPAGLSKVVELARAHSDKAIGALVTALEDQDPMVRMKAADLLLIRAWGKPAQALDSDTARYELARLESERRVHEAKSKMLAAEYGRSLRSGEQLAAMFPSASIK